MTLDHVYRWCCALALTLACGWATASDIGAVVLHGKWGSPQRAVDTLANALRDQGYGVSVPEMPWSRSRAYDADVAAADLQIDGEIAKLREGGAKHVFVIGHSLGANFALHYASRAPQPLAGVIGIAPGHRPESPFYARAFANDIRQAKALAAGGKSEQTISFMDLNTGNRSEAKRAAVATFLSYFDPEGPLNLARNARQLKADVPVLWLVPKGEDARLRDATVGLYAGFPASPRHKFAEPDSDHIGAPGASVPLVLDWIREVAAKK